MEWLPLAHPDLLLALALLVAGIVLLLSAPGRGGEVAGGTLLLVSVVAGTLGVADSELTVVAILLACAVAGIILVVGREEADE